MELTDTQKRKLRELAVKYGIDLILLYGSAAKGQQGPLSDLDIGVWLRHNSQYGQRDFFGLMQAVQEVFPEEKVDLVLLNQADPLLLKNVATNCKLLYGSPKRQEEFYLYAISRYQDYRPYLQQEAGYVDKALGL